jgi:hypothetical protein
MNNILYTPNPSDWPARGAVERIIEENSYLTGKHVLGASIFQSSLIQKDGVRAGTPEVIRLELRFATVILSGRFTKNPTAIDRVTDGLCTAGLK